MKRTPPNRVTHTIDATSQAPGRIATEAVRLLRGKHKTSFTPHLEEGDFVKITHAEKMKFTGAKLDQKFLIHHTLHPGGIKRRPLKKVFEKNPGEVLVLAIRKMLPKNRQRDKIMRRLMIER